MFPDCLYGKSRFTKSDQYLRFFSSFISHIITHTHTCTRWSIYTFPSILEDTRLESLEKDVAESRREEDVLLLKDILFPMKEAAERGMGGGRWDAAGKGGADIWGGGRGGEVVVT